MLHIDDAGNAEFRELLGPAEDIEWFGNEVCCGQGYKRMDVLCYRGMRVGEDLVVRRGYSVIELKKGDAEEANIGQTLEYADWVSAHLSEHGHEAVQAVLIARKMGESVRTAAEQSELRGCVGSFRLAEYCIEDGELRLSIVR